MLSLPALKLASPAVMGILNVNPDSFSHVGRYQHIDSAVNHCLQMQADGAGIIDIGAEPTNPSLHPWVSEQEELDRIMPVIEALAQVIEVPLSLDTSKPSVMKAAVAAGVSIINDVRALTAPTAVETVAQLQTPVVLMHMEYPQGVPDQPSPVTDIFSHVKQFLQQRIEACVAAGIRRDNIIVDPGFGHGNFGKSTKQNLQLLNQLHRFADLNAPMLVGLSRKTFIGEVLQLNQEQRLAGSLAVAVTAVEQGAQIIRAHDVKETVQALTMVTAVKEAQLNE